MTGAGAVWLIGGSGTVGAQVAEMLRRKHPVLPMVIAGRREERAQALADRLGHAKARCFDISCPDFDERPAAIAVLVNDWDEQVLDYALTEGVPLVDVTRWSERQHLALVRIAARGPQSPVVLASSWMASVAAVIARGAAARLGAAPDSIDLDILFALADAAGPDSVAYMDRLDRIFAVFNEGQWRSTGGFVDGRRMDFLEGGRHRVYGFDTPDLTSLPTLTGARSVTTRIGFDSQIATQSLRLLVRTGLWRLFSGERWSGLRRAVLYNPGTGAPHRLVITAAGGGRCVTARVTDQIGQAHLTAVGAAVQIERLLGLDGGPVPAAGAVLGEALIEPALLIRRLTEEGVVVAWSHS